ncbi:hypothetical protein F504_1259 [Ralstonia pseudosolanacearum FQY_4]|nr:hypothetical protein F504_1259 [Ralstonia pseudosolanacearum FQY_4]
MPFQRRAERHFSFAQAMSWARRRFGVIGVDAPGAMDACVSAWSRRASRWRASVPAAARTGPLGRTHPVRAGAQLPPAGADSARAGCRA